MYDTSISLNMGQVLVSGARLGSWTASLLSRVVSVVTPPLPAWIAGSLQGKSLALSDYAIQCTAQKYMNPPHGITEASRDIKIIVEDFLTKKLNSLFQELIRENARKFYSHLNEYLQSDGGSSIDYSIAQDIKQRCQERFICAFKDEKLQSIFDSSEKKFLRQCMPPEGFIFHEFLDAIPAKSKTKFGNAIICENISLEALSYYHYNFICKVFRENRDIFIQSLQKTSKAEVKKVTEELGRVYDAKITSHMQRKASNLLKLQVNQDASPPLPAHGRINIKRPAEDPRFSPERKVEMIVAFEKAHYRLKNADPSFKEFRSLKKIINIVLQNEQLKECVTQLCGITKIREAVTLSKLYTMKETEKTGRP
ncbi:hypothetical protein J7438_05345 [Thalassotalea sp. G20_0]|uniref:hypothetical protein n=1 Tax=Thalassotalea sp. G20_0 TaxID=2821093 RepID=UPI001ADB7E90|nr:hypothetical protein [Thalassotalea sp. G20_0]MBO9493512.1 hypothetical protein [Thalassotalea sp. G20_0]